MTNEAPPTNVVEALARVIHEIPSIGKTTGAQGLNYKFRSIEQLTSHAATLFAKYGLVISPLGDTMEYVEVATAKGGSMTEARGRYQWRIYGPGGPDDFIDAASFGQARDTSDKAANKAHTAAFKYLLMTLLCIADNKEDGDFERLGEQEEYEEEDVAEMQRFNQLMTEAVEGKEKYGDGWANALRDQATTEGHVSVNAWFRADPDAAEKFVTQHKMKAEMALRSDEPVEHGPQAEPPPRKRAKAGSAVKNPEPETHAQAALRVVEAFPEAEFVDDEPELDLS